MSADDMLAQLRILQKEADEIRRRLNVSGPGEILFLASLLAESEEEVVVRADGFGGASMMIVEGNYPIDFLTHREEAFPTEAAAKQAAERLTGMEDETPFT